MRGSAAIAKHELRAASRELDQLFQAIVMPLGMIAFLSPAFTPALQAQGLADASGADQAVPGMIVMFSFFASGMIGFRFFREHGWRTWQRLRSSAATPTAIAVGKVVPTFALTLLQQAILFTAGVVLFGMQVRGSVLGLAVVSLALTTTLVCLGLVFAAVLRTSEQLNAASGATAMLLSGLGGAFAPLEVLPSWAQALAPLTPTYWGMQGFIGVIQDGAGLVDSLRPAVVLLGFAAVFLVVAVRRMRFDEAKRITF